MSNQVIPIFYACDDNFVKYTIVSLRSMMENASKGNQYKVYILNTDISGRMKKIIPAICMPRFALGLHS